VSGGVLVAGIGNIFQSDDGFGVEVAHRLHSRTLPVGVRVEDYGIRGVHLAYELLNGYDGLVILDALPMGEPPGTLALLEPDVDAPTADDEMAPVMDAHTMSPHVVLATLARLGGRVEPIFVLGCQPATLEEGMTLSPPVAASIDGAVDMCVELVARILEPAGKGTLSCSDVR
jgi:hydrogenase maturation protease